MVCQGETTGIIDVAELSEGVTFINKNLYPALYPFMRSSPRRSRPTPVKLPRRAVCIFCNGPHHCMIAIGTTCRWTIA